MVENIYSLAQKGIQNEIEKHIPKSEALIDDILAKIGQQTQK